MCGAIFILVFALLFFICIRSSLVEDHENEQEKEDDLFQRCLNDEFKSEYSKATSEGEFKRMAKRRIS